MSKGTSIPVKWDTKRKLEKLKFDIETKLERKLSWDEFFNKVKINMNNTKIKKDGEK